MGLENPEGNGNLEGAPTASREAAKPCSPQRKLWAAKRKVNQAPEGAREKLLDGPAENRRVITEKQTASR
jgi:hypothetical protein